MKITNTEKFIENDDLIIIDFVCSDSGSYQLRRNYLGGYNSENEEEAPENALGCIIELSETCYNPKHFDIMRIFHALLDTKKYTRDELSFYDDLVYVSFPEVRRTLAIEDYESFDNTENIYQFIMDNLKAGENL